MDKKRLIDAVPILQDFIKIADRNEGKNPYENVKIKAYRRCFERVADAPKVDAVEVVRCGECGHHEKLPEEIDPDICYNPNPFGSEKRIFCRKLGFVVSEDFYCKHGERKEQ